MNQYKLSVRIFLVVVWLLGLFATVDAFFSPNSQSLSAMYNRVGALLAIVLAAVAGARKVRLIRSPRHSDAVTMSLGYLITYAALLTYGVPVGVLVGIVSALSSSLYPKRQPMPNLLFNLANVAVASYATGWTYDLLTDGRVNHAGLPGACAAILAALVYFLLNTGLVASVYALIKEQSLWTIWKQSFMWTGPGYLLGASFITLGQMLFNPDSRLIFVGNLVIGSGAKLMILALPVLVFLYQSYHVYAEKEEQKERYIAELEAGRQTLHDLYMSTVKSLATAIDAKDQYTHKHLHRVQRYALAIAEQLKVEGEELEAIRTGSLLHDIGKLGVPDYVLLKPGPLTEEEFEKMKRHTTIGAVIIEQIAFPWPVSGIVRNHHERWDGSGYPDKLVGEAIPLGARILAIADVYDALTSERPYRPAWSRAEAQAYIRAGSGAQFDPRIVQAFLDVAATVDALDDQEFAVARSLAPAEHQAAGHIWRTSVEQWAFYEMSQILNASQPIEEKLKLLGSKIATIVPGATCSFLLHNPSAASATAGQWQWAVTAAAGDILQSASPLREDGLFAQVARARRVYRGVYAEEGLEISTTPPDNRPFRSALIVPMTHQEEILGAINLYHTIPDAFTEDDENLLLRIAQQVQNVLYHDILFDRTRSDALTDSLTGLYNVRYFKQVIEPLLRAPSTMPFALLYLDLDHFKPINDHFGHQQGNEVLQNVAHLFHCELRPDDLVVRYGGDEFLIVLRQTSKLGAKRVAERIRKTIQRYDPGLVSADGKTFRLDISIGIACFPSDGQELHELVTTADQRMYAQKTDRKYRALAVQAASPSSAEIQAVVQIQDTNVHTC